MTNHRLGHDDEARKWLDQATESTSGFLTESHANRDRPSWNRRLTLELLHAEATTLIGDLPPQNEAPQLD